MNTPPRILLVGNYAPDRQYSMLRYAGWLAGALRGQGLAVDLVAPPLRLGKFAGKRASLRKWFGFIDKFVLFTLALRRQARNYDLVHICDHSNAPYVLAIGGRRVSVSCHDLIPIKVLAGEIPSEKLPRTATWLQRLIRFSLRRAPHLVFVSEATRADFVRLVKPIAPARDVIANPVIGFGTMTPARAQALMAMAGLPTDRPFLLHVGSNLWYKNRAGAIRLFGLLRLRPETDLGEAVLICAGPALPDEAVLEAEGWRERLIVVSGAANELIEALYTRAAALLFPSLDEGFGWPIIEAQACGCPVITSDREPMRSVAGSDAAIRIDPLQLEDAAAAIATRWRWLMGRREAARAHAAGFSEQKAARQYAECLAGFVGASAEPRA